MKARSIIFLSMAAIGFMTFYHFIPFLIVGGASGSFAKLRPFLLAGSVLSLVLGFYQSWRKQSKVPAARLSAVVLWVSSVVVLGMILFSQAVANILANALGD